MKANLQSARIAPKKANLIAKMVRGMSVPDAMEALRRTDKKAARLVEKLLRSAIANASHNDRQDPQMMVVKTIVVNQGQALHRGVPMARGRVRPMKKYLSHISVTLGFAEQIESGELRKENAAKKQEAPSRKPKNSVKTSSTRKGEMKGKSSASSGAVSSKS